jgi:hypothetical protein
VIITFEVDLPEGRSVREQEIGANFDALRDALAAAPNPEGVLLLRDEKRGVGTAFLDALEPLLLNVCLYSAPALSAGQEAAFDLFSSPGRVSLKPVGGEVAVSRDGAEMARFPRDELLPALRSCGERYAALMEKLHGADPNWELRLAMMGAAVASARGEEGRSEKAAEAGPAETPP